MYDPTYPLFPILAFLGFVMVLIPLPWHLHAWNSGTCFYMMWSGLACLNQFINTVVWANDVIDKAPVWCDISIRIVMASSVAIPAASLCINRRLYQIAQVQAVSISPSDKRRAIITDALICVAFPLVFVALQYIVQGHRYNLFEQIGPQTALVNMLPVYFITLMWPPLIGCISACYGVLSLRSFFRRRAAFSQFLQPSSGSGLTTSRYLRLMALSTLDILLTTPLGIVAIYLDYKVGPMQPWVSLSNTHFDYDRVIQFPAVVWTNEPDLARAVRFTQWVPPATALVFFLFFGFAAEARKNYMTAIRASVSFFWRCLARVGIQRPTTGFFALASTTKSPSSKGRPSFVASSSPIKPKLPPIRHSALSISLPLPLYSTGSLTEVAGSSASPSSTEFTDLKRAPSYASGSTRATYGYIYDGAGSPDVDGSRCDSRFVEHLGEVYDLEKGVPPEHDAEKFEEPSRRDEHPSYYMHDSRPIDTPSTATSFPPSSPSAASASTLGHDSAPVTPNFALPLHLGWATRPYPAVYAGEQTTASSLVEPARERQSWSPAPSPSSEAFAMESMRERERPASTGSAETTGGRGRSRTLV